jgi:ribosomal protein S3AE
LITHLTGRVGAFRSNQNRHSLLSRNSASRESLAFSGRYGQGAIRGIKGGRLAAANTPITPLRKSKISKAELIVSPSPAEGADKKRKFTGESHGHKRVRSLF